MIMIVKLSAFSNKASRVYGNKIEIAALLELTNEGFSMGYASFSCGG